MWAWLWSVRIMPSGRARRPKWGEYLACGLAVAATEGVGDLNDHFQGSDVAITIAPSDEPSRIVDRILEALKTTDRVAKARALAERQYDLQTAVGSLAAVYRTLGVEPCE